MAVHREERPESWSCLGVVLLFCRAGSHQSQEPEDPEVGA